MLLRDTQEIEWTRLGSLLAGGWQIQGGRGRSWEQWPDFLSDSSVIPFPKIENTKGGGGFAVGAANDSGFGFESLKHLWDVQVSMQGDKWMEHRRLMMTNKMTDIGSDKMRKKGAESELILQSHFSSIFWRETGEEDPAQKTMKMRLQLKKTKEGGIT